MTLNEKIINYKIVDFSFLENFSINFVFIQSHMKKFYFSSWDHLLSSPALEIHF